MLDKNIKWEYIDDSSKRCLQKHTHTYKPIGVYSTTVMHYGPSHITYTNITYIPSLFIFTQYTGAVWVKCCVSCLHKERKFLHSWEHTSEVKVGIPESKMRKIPSKATGCDE